jgi:RNA-directed DNA polymerase
MTVTLVAGAASLNAVEWHTINWRKAHREVRRLQARIVKATQAGRWGKVKALQRLLTRSYSAKVLAVKRVTDNEGKRTPGIDGELWDTPQKKAQAVQSMHQRGYRPQPLRRIYLAKANGKQRPLGIPTLKDRAMQALYKLALDPVAETTADPNSYGFRPERSTADAIGQCFLILSRQQSATWIFEADIRGCFDNISHDWLETNIPIETGILRHWLKAGYLEKEVFHKTEDGTPQGGVISPVLANMALDGLEKRLKEHFSKRTQKGRQAKVNFIRFADDFIITGNSAELLENEVKPLVVTFLQTRGLTLSPTKTHITPINKGFDFLGQNIRKYNGKLLITPSKKNIKRFLAKVRAIIKAYRPAPAGLLIAKLNPVIRGWARYHRHVASKRIFAKVDHAIFNALWQWATRRHPKKGNRWVKQKYFKRIRDRNWVFLGEHNGKAWRLTQASDTPIRRHPKVQGAANPFDPDWELYFEARLTRKMAYTLQGARQVDYLWCEQNGICPICHQPITETTGWHNHHIIWRSLGGSDTVDNRVLLHPNCHRQVHSQHLHVEKPRPSPGG